MNGFRKTAYLWDEGQQQTPLYWLNLPEPLASWDVFEYWERPRVEHMRATLQRGDTLFDVGAEFGWQSVVYAKMVCPENMVLVEPSTEFWPNIRQIWERNVLTVEPPKACYHGLFSDKTSDPATLKGWPQASVDGPLATAQHYRSLKHKGGAKEITLDDFVAGTKIVPRAVTMDVEGAELLVLRGAMDTLKRHKPLLWVSIHPTLMDKTYGHRGGDVHALLQSAGYTGTFLSVDHEEHWFFSG